MLLEVISVCPQDSRVIQDCSANRIQLVSGLQIGGLTPCSSIIRKSLQAVSIPTNILLRHHNNGFFYTKQQKQLLLQDVYQCKDIFKPSGIVIGGILQTLQNEGHEQKKVQIDQNFLNQIMKEVGGKMTVTFHKASDQTSSLQQSINVLKKFGVHTVLTQGGKKPIEENYDILKPLINKNDINILLGGGINHKNIISIVENLKPKEVHIGTCVRTQKYGNVSQIMLKQFIEKLNKTIY